MKIVIIDGQGGKIGCLLVEKIKASSIGADIFAIGSNSIATSSMLKAGADFGATGENPVVVNCADADFIVGPLGIIVANSLLGEITPKMAVAVSESKAHKLLLPVNKCNNFIIAISDISLSQMIAQTVDKILELIQLS